MCVRVFNLISCERKDAPRDRRLAIKSKPITDGAAVIISYPSFVGRMHTSPCSLHFKHPLCLWFSTAYGDVLQDNVGASSPFSESLISFKTRYGRDFRGHFPLNVVIQPQTDKARWLVHGPNNFIILLSVRDVTSKPA